MARSTSRSVRTRLKFKKPIVSTVKDPISTKELLVRLQALSDELSAINQDNVDISSLKQIKNDLVNKKLLNHSNIGVQAYVCCAISDILRINAPNAPYTASELSSVFGAFFRQFKKLSDQENPYFQQQCYLLKRLAEVRSIILITDLPDAEQLIEQIFETFYHLSAQDFPSKLEPLAADILSEIISESEIIPHKVIKMILDNFLTHSSETSAITAGAKSNISNPGLNFSIQICEINLDRMQRLVAQYFSEMLYEGSSRVESSNEVTNIRVTNKNKVERSTALENLNKIHKLSIQIWKYIPELLGTVMGLIDDELNAGDEIIRSLATETIGRIIGSTNLVSGTFVNKVNFFISHKVTWTNWLKKTTDVSPAVRAKWVEQLPLIINSSTSSTSEISNSLSNCLYKCLLDTEEKVRLAACKSIEKIPFSNFTNKICNKNIMTTLSHLTREKNPEIRSEAIKIFGNLYDQYLKATESNQVIDFGNNNEEESAELEKLIYQGIPNQVLSLIYINDRNITSAVDLCIFEKLLPVAESNSIKRVDRLAQFYHTLDGRGKQSFIAINRRQQQVSKVLQTFIETSEKYNRIGSSTEDKENMSSSSNKSQDNNQNKQSLLMKMDKIIKWICASFPDGLNTYACFERFFKLNKARFLYLIKISISPESDYNTVRNSMKELLTKLSDPKNLKLEDERTNVTSSEMVSNFKLLLLRAAVLLYNKSNVVELINYSKDPNHQWHSTANEILEHISVSLPDVFKCHVKGLTNLVVNTEEDQKSSIPKSHNLRTIYHFIKRFPDLFPNDINFTESLKSISINGTPRESRYAIKILGLSDKKELYGSSIVNSIYPLDLTHKNFATHLSALAGIFLVDPLAVQDKSSELTSLLIKEVFLKNRSIDKEAAKDETGWLDDDILDINFQLHSTLYEKLLALRILVNKLKAYDMSESIITEEDKGITEQAQPIFKLLISLIGNRGEIINKKSPTWPTPELYKSKIRLTAGLYLLKLAKYPRFNEMIYPTTIRRLTFLLVDPNYNVRSQFLFNLQKKLVNESISERFLPIIFFSASEPSNDLKNNAIMWIKSSYKRQELKGNITFEKSLVRIIHILAHHEQFITLMNGNQESEDNDNDNNLIQAYIYASRYIIFFLTLIAKAENISLLYYFASRVKQHRDTTVSSELYESDTLPQEILNLYRVSELAQLIIKEYSDQKNWPMQTWPGKLKLPSDIYAPMESTKEVQSIITKVFVPDKIQIDLMHMIRKRLAGDTSKRRPSLEPSAEKVKRARIQSTKPRISKPKSTIKSRSRSTEITPRRSARVTQKVNYGEGDNSEIDYDESDEYSD